MNTGPAPPGERSMPERVPLDRGGGPASAAERMLADAAERALRMPRGRLVLALHLAQLKPPAPRPHHSRIARALMQDAAARHGGQVFPMRNGDLVLLTGEAEGEARAGSPTAPLALPAAFARLFGADAPAPEQLSSIWRLENQGEGLRAYLAARLRDPTPPADLAAGAMPVGEDGATTPATLAALDTVLTDTPLPDLLGQQTAIELIGAANLPLLGRLRPLFRELTISMAALQSREDIADVAADPFLFRAFATRLDARMLAYLQEDLAGGGKLTRAALRQNLPIHLNLTLQQLVSPGFARLTQVARRAGARFGIEVSMMEAAADPDLLEFCRSLLDMSGFALVLDGLDHVGLVMTHPAGLRPALVKLTWSPRLADAPPPQRAAIDAAIQRLTPARILLARAETEDAVAWGQSRGITRYQGYFLDAVQAAGRIAQCHSAGACTLRQCMGRAAILAPQGRAGCGNPALLDAVPAPGGQHNAAAGADLPESPPAIRHAAR